MPTVTKTWVFASDNEDVADGGGHVSITLNHDTSGNPGGSMDFITADTALTDAVEYARSATGVTWEDWGVPAGATVTDVRVKYDWIQWGNENRITSHGHKMRVVDSGGTSVHSAGDLVSNDPSTNVDHGAWQVVGFGTSRAVDSGKQASTTEVRLEVEYRITRVATGADLCDVGFDNIAVEITYTEGGGSQVLAARGLSYDVLNSVQASRGLSYDVQAQVQASRALSYDVANSVVAARALSYDLIAFLAVARGLSYDVLAAVLAARALSYDVLVAGQVQAPRALSYDVLAAVLAARGLSYDVLVAVLAARGLSYDVLNALAVSRGLVYDLGDVEVPAGATRQGLWYW